ncbi:hypothetical protein NGRA_1390 [Nosema granulosis]|uniref:Uncharacterized protein n=1 Tax=Nosema granulosis TaxID=83296 RepID=A0A9P6KZ79_9MICR|nr:hypothetical protein NGRA_1390 [Nosema granulosis]
MTNNNFDERIIKQYQNRILTENEISRICTQAVEEGILQKEDIKRTTGCTTVELLNNIKEWKSAFLHNALKLDGSSDSELETAKENIEEEHNKLYEIGNTSYFYTPSKRSESFYSQIYNSPIAVGKTEPDNPFSSPFRRPNENTSKENNSTKEILEFESFCEDLKEKTRSIKKQSTDRTAETVKKLVDRFIDYTEKRKPGPKDSGKRFYAFVIFLILSLICLYTPKPV